MPQRWAVTAMLFMQMTSKSLNRVAPHVVALTPRPEVTTRKDNTPPYSDRPTCYFFFSLPATDSNLSLAIWAHGGRVGGRNTECRVNSSCHEKASAGQSVATAGPAHRVRRARLTGRPWPPRIPLFPRVWADYTTRTVQISFCGSSGGLSGPEVLPIARRPVSQLFRTPPPSLQHIYRATLQPFLLLSR